jgi:hypothetical protein
LLDIALLIQKERDALYVEDENANKLIRLLLDQMKEIKEIPMINGKKGGAKIIYADYYVIVNQIIAAYKGDLFVRGAISRIVRMADNKIRKKMLKDQDISLGIPSQKQAENIVKKLRESK